jgi:acyl-CoA reductase-like NAD-dependent aldehyde dehydrogenase
MRACNEIKFGETHINRENFEAMQGFHAGWRKSGIGGADGKAWTGRVFPEPCGVRGLQPE